MVVPPFCDTQAMIPQCVNTGAWVAAWTLDQLRALPADCRFTLPICSLHTPVNALHEAGRLCLPPLYLEAVALDDGLRDLIVDQILRCFPVWNDPVGNRARVDVVEHELTDQATPEFSGRVVAFSVDTAVEEHGPHLPLGTDTIQSYSVLHALRDERADFDPVRPLDYGQLTWGLPFGFSVDLTTAFVTRYVRAYVNALIKHCGAEMMYVVDVHGSITHRQAIVEGLQTSDCSRWAFRWLHEPLAEFASARGDQHAGGVETSLVEHVSEHLIDREWFPAREEQLVAGGMTLEKAVELTPHLSGFRQYVVKEGANGIVGDIRNYHTLNSSELFARMLDLAREDVALLVSGEAGVTDAGVCLW